MQSRIAGEDSDSWYFPFLLSFLLSTITQKIVGRGLNHCENTHAITISASHMEKSQCAREQQVCGTKHACMSG